MSEPPSLERFLIDENVNPELAILLKKIGFAAKFALQVPSGKQDAELLVWCRGNGYILVCYDKHRDAETRYALHSEMYYRGGQIIRLGGPQGQSPLVSLGLILAHRPVWQEHFRKDSGVAVVHPGGCNFTSAEKLFQRSRFSLNLELEDPAVPIHQRIRTPSRPRQKEKPSAQPGPRLV